MSSQIYYGFSQDPQIQAMIGHLSPMARDAVNRRDLIAALKSHEMDLKSYLRMISNPEEGIILA